MSRALSPTLAALRYSPSPPPLCRGYSVAVDAPCALRGVGSVRLPAMCLRVVCALCLALCFFHVAPLLSPVRVCSHTHTLSLSLFLSHTLSLSFSHLHTHSLPPHLPRAIPPTLPLNLSIPSLQAPAYQELKTTKEVKDFIERMQVPKIPTLNLNHPKP